MKLFFLKHKVFFLTILFVCGLAGVLFGSYTIWQSRQPRQVATPEPIQLPTASPVTELDPLQIEAVKARSYPGSTISTEQTITTQVSIVSYLSDDNKVFALLTTPVGTAPSDGWPVVILNHGYINPALYRTNDGSYSGVTAALTQAGIAVIKPDYRGHGQSQGVPEGGHFSPVYTYDDMNLISSIAQTPALSLNPNRLGTLGHSLGAHTSLRVAVVNPNIKATAYLSGVVGSIDDILYNWPFSPMPGDMPARVQANRETLLAKYGTPKTNPDFWGSVSAINYVGNITGASQIQHSTNDSTVPKLFSDKLDTALKSANKSVEYYTYPGNDHQLSTNATLVNSRLVSFFSTHLQ